MEIRDIHTHFLPEVPGTALVCIGCGPLSSDGGQWYSAGLHPWDVTGNDQDKFQALEKLLSDPQVIAVGECGFDTLRGPSHDVQEKAFLRQVELSEKFQKPMILHVVRGFDSVIRLHKLLKPTQSWLVHGFRGGPEQMRQLHSNGILVSFGLKHNEESLRQVPSEQLYLETDGKCTIEQTVLAAAQIRNETTQAIEWQILRNNNILLQR